jgi:hypothetical protein
MTTALSYRRRLTAVAVVLMALSGLLVKVAISASASVPPTPSGWSLVWSDDFNGSAGTLPSSGNWIIDTGHAYPGRTGQLGHRRDPELHLQHRQPQP